MGNHQDAVPASAPPHLAHPGPRSLTPTITRNRVARLPDIAYGVLGHIRLHHDGIHGYRLSKLLSASPSRQPALPLGQLYRLLRRLENGGLVTSRVETRSARLRYRFTITPEGERRLEEWLRCCPSWSATLCQQLLHRLQFADRLPEGVMQRLVDEATRECQRHMDALRRESLPGVENRWRSPRYETAIRARLETDLRWLDDVRRMMSASADAPVRRVGQEGPGGSCHDLGSPRLSAGASRGADRAAGRAVAPR